MTEQTQDTSHTRLVNVDMLSTQELKAQELQAEPTQEQVQPTLQPAPSAYRPINKIQHLFELGVRFFVTIFAATTLFGLVALLVLMWIVPPWYRDLTPRNQVIWCNRVEALCDLQNKAPDDGVLALDNSNVDSSGVGATVAISDSVVKAVLATEVGGGIVVDCIINVKAGDAVGRLGDIGYI